MVERRRYISHTIKIEAHFTQTKTETEGVYKPTERYWLVTIEHLDGTTSTRCDSKEEIINFLQEELSIG